MTRVVVLGAGIVGASTAFHLARALCPVRGPVAAALWLPAVARGRRAVP